MFVQYHFILILSIISSITLAAIYDTEYIKQNGPSGLIFFKKNDSFVNWIRVPEIHYKQWIDALKIWRTVKINDQIEPIVFNLYSIVFDYSWHAMFNLCSSCSCLYHSWILYECFESIRLFR